MSKISVIIPVYNAEEYISECINSLLNQTFQDFEVICVDDGSTDNSVEIIKNYQVKDNRIKLFLQKNSGPGRARNTGICVAEGQFVCFLDSDDCLSNNALELLYNTQIKNNSDFVVAKIRLFDNITPKTIKVRGWQGNNIMPNKQYIITNLYKNIFQIVSPVGHAKLFNIRIIKENNLLFSDYRMAEDALFIYTYLLYCNSITFISNNIYQYRMNISNSLAGQNSEYFLDFNKSFLKLKDNILEQNLYIELKKTWFIAYLYCFIHILKIASIKKKVFVFKNSIKPLFKNFINIIFNN